MWDGDYIDEGWNAWVKLKEFVVRVLAVLIVATLLAGVGLMWWGLMMYFHVATGGKW